MYDEHVVRVSRGNDERARIVVIVHRRGGLRILPYYKDEGESLEWFSGSITSLVGA